MISFPNFIISDDDIVDQRIVKIGHWIFKIFFSEGLQDKVFAF